MSGDDGPKLYANKPKKSAQLKQQRKSTVSSSYASNPMASAPSSSSSSSSSSATTTSSSSGSGLPPPKESLARRFKFVWPILLTLNLGIGAYVYLSASKKDKDAKKDDEAVADVPSTPAATTTTASVPEKSVPTPVIAEPVKLREPIPENQQRELFKWILEEKRKIKPKDPEEKKQIDEEKAVLKQFIRGKSVPSF